MKRERGRKGKAFGGFADGEDHARPGPLMAVPAIWEAMRIHKEKGKFHYGKKGEILPDQAMYELGIVSYPRQGKYTDCNIFIPYHDLPDIEELADENQRRRTSPPGQGWWPVIHLRTEVVSPFMKKVLVVCWYQLLSDGRVICWWIYL